MTLTTMMLAATAQIVTVDPGHFHAALVQNRTYPEVANEVHVFAPDGPELESHLKLIESFNTRKENPTAWKETVTRGDDYLERFVEAAKAGALGKNPIVILAGKNNRKGDYALAAVEAGCNVLSDKPMGITPEVYAKTERAARIAQEKGLFFADIMTERKEITTILQRELVLDRDLYGEQEKGTPEDPAVVKESVHHFCKLVNGAPLKRPAWYYDTKVQGEGLTDVTTHLVDIVQWVVFPDERLDKGDVKIMSARTWPTMITPAEFKMSTGGTVDKTFACESNGEFVWRLKDVHCKVSVVWNFMAPKGTGDTHYSLLRGTKAEIFIRQGEKENYKPVLYVRARQDAAATEKALMAAIARIAKARPGVTAVPVGEAGLWRIAYPKAYDIGHEAHFSQVVRTYLDWMKQGKEDPIYIDNMIVKYFTIEEAWRMAKATKPVTVKVDWAKSAGPVKPVNGVGQGPILGWNGFSMFRYLKEAGTPILRYHDVGGAFGGNRFVDIPNIFRDFDADENDPKNYDFGFTDQLVDATVRNGMEPFYRLGVTIENHPEVKVYRITPPKDFAKWARVCEHIIRHYNEGWANGRRYGIKYWEIWNEPDDMPDLKSQSYMWRGEFAEYIRLYDVTARHLKKCFPDIKVGGYASCGFYAATEAKPSRRSQAYVDRFREFLKFVKENGTPIDFFSYHSYAERPEEILKQAGFARRTLDEFGFKGLETSLNEWHSGTWLKDRGTAAHAARQAAILLAMQNGPVDTAVFYDGRCGVSRYGGLFNPLTFKPFKAYWGFYAFNQLRLRKNAVEASCDGGEGFYVAAARNGADGAVMVVNTTADTKRFALELGAAKATAAYIVDADRDFVPCPVPTEIPPHSIVVVLAQ